MNITMTGGKMHHSIMCVRKVRRK